MINSLFIHDCYSLKLQVVDTEVNSAYSRYSTNTILFVCSFLTQLLNKFTWNPP